MKRESLCYKVVSLSTAGTRKRKQPATEENKVRLREDAEVRVPHGESSTGLALLNHPSKQVESPFRLAADPMPDWHFRLAACATQREMHCHPRLVRFARCVLRKWRRYCPGAIFNAR